MNKHFIPVTEKPLKLIALALAALLLVSCYRSPITVTADISPEPIVGQVVTLHIEIKADGRAMPNTTVTITLPAGVEAVNNDLTWAGDIAAGETASVDISIRVITEGEWPIEIYAFSHSTPDSEYGIGDLKTLHIRSSETSAEVIDDSDYIMPTIPVVSGDSATLPPGSLVPLTIMPNTLTPSVGEHITLTGQFIFMIGEIETASGTFEPSQLYVLSNEQDDWILDIDQELLAALGRELYTPPKYITVEGEVLPDYRIRVESITYAAQ